MVRVVDPKDLNAGTDSKLCSATLIRVLDALHAISSGNSIGERRQ